MITDFHQPALSFKVQWLEWHPRGWCPEWTGYATREEAEAKEADIRSLESLNSHTVRHLNPGDDVTALVDMLNEHHR